MYVNVCVVVAGRLSAGAIPQVAMIQGHGRLTLTLTTIWHCVWRSIAAIDACGSEKRAVKMSCLGPVAFTVKEIMGRKW